MSGALATGSDAPASPDSSLAGRSARAALRVAAVLYGLGARIHRGFMGWTAAGRGRLACAVVSVGGLTVGGAGKTPVAARLALSLHRRGWRVVLVSRGYRGRDRSAVSVVSDGARIHSSVARSGDESFVLAAHAPGVPVLVGRDRRVVGHHAVAAFDAEIVVLDDGFQHHRLARDIDVVCIDGSGGFGNGRSLPAGPLREPISTLRHADWLCIVDPPLGADADEPAEVEARARDARRVAVLERDGCKVIRAWRSPTDLISLDHAEVRSIESLRGRRVGLLSGIGRPASFRRTIESLGAEVVLERRFRDHHDYGPADCADLDDRDLDWITTEKDALKILPAWLGSTRLWVLRVEVEFEREADFLERIESRLRAAGRLPSDRTVASPRLRTAGSR